MQKNGEWDHPRACGEQAIRELIWPNEMGSSPRVRGAVLCEVSRSALEGIIPARAGSSISVSISTLIIGDHPRACGEQYWQVNRPGMGQGSSPRVRGAASVFPKDMIYLGIIPARAGSSVAVDL